MRRRVQRALRPALAVLVALTSLTAVESASGAGRGGKAVAAPSFVRTIETGQTGWFSSPGLVDLNRDGRLEIVAPFYTTFVFGAKGRPLGQGTATSGRVYAPSVVADMDGDRVPEVVVGGNEGTVAAYNLRGGELRLKPGWPASTCSGGQCPETRGLAAADLDRDGRAEVVATTTNTSPTGAQVFVFDGSGALLGIHQARGRRHLRPLRPASFGAGCASWMSGASRRATAGARPSSIPLRHSLQCEDDRDGVLR